MDANAKMPKFRGESFTCPLCQVYATQTWVDDYSLIQIFQKFEKGYFNDYKVDISSHDQKSIHQYLDDLHQEMRSLYFF